MEWQSRHVAQRRGGDLAFKVAGCTRLVLPATSVTSQEPPFPSVMIAITKESRCDIVVSRGGHPGLQSVSKEVSPQHVGIEVAAQWTEVALNLTEDIRYRTREIATWVRIRQDAQDGHREENIVQAPTALYHGTKQVERLGEEGCEGAPVPDGSGFKRWQGNVSVTLKEAGHDAEESLKLLSPTGRWIRGVCAGSNVPHESGEFG